MTRLLTDEGIVDVDPDPDPEEITKVAKKVLKRICKNRGVNENGLVEIPEDARV